MMEWGRGRERERERERGKESPVHIGVICNSNANLEATAGSDGAACNVNQKKKIQKLAENAAIEQTRLSATR